jgi:glycosyltransferase involved in cell wall biosynthesis
MRILHVVRSDSFAGVERHIADLAAAQSEAGHDVHVVGGDPRRMRNAIGRDSVGHTPAATVLTAARAIVAHPSQDVINVHMTAAEAAAAIALPARAVPVVSTRHFAGRRGSTRIVHGLARLTSRRVTAQIAVSHYVALHVEGVSTVVHAGVPLQPDTLPAANRERSVLVAQRLEPEKRSDVAVRAFAASGLADEGWRLDIAGKGTQRGALERLARRLKIAPAVRFLGSRSDIDRLMDDASILFASRPDEAYGLSVLEAMATGLPVVATGAGGHLETVGSVEGAALFPPGDAAAAGRLLAELAADSGRRDAYGKALQEAQRTRFTLEAQVAATDAVYRSVL